MLGNFKWNNCKIKSQDKNSKK